MCKYIDILKREIKQIQLYLSANIIKNALGGGILGTGKIEIAAVLGGAKTICALKIATAINTAIQCSTSSNTIPSSKDGIVFDDVEETLKKHDK